MELASQRQLKTLSRADADFGSYLDGSFSIALIALPVRSLNIGTPTEEITFEILPHASIERPGFFAIASALARPSTLVFSIGTMWVSWMHVLATGRTQSLFLSLSAFSGVLVFHIAMNLFNDYGDHIRGQDRVRPFSGSRAIQKGWVRAHSVRKFATGILILAIGLGVPAAIASPVIVIAGIALLIALEFAFQRLRLKARGWSEILAFALAGPLLTGAFAWAISKDFIASDITLGFVMGLIALLYFHAANLENIMSDSQAGASTWATRAGFEASLAFFTVVASAIPLAALLQVAMDQSLTVSFVAAAQTFFLVPLMARVRKFASPLSSELVGLRNRILELAWITVLAFSSSYALIFFFGFQP